MPKPIAAALALLLLALAGPALGSEPGSAKGTVTVGDEATPLSHAYAWEETDIPEMRFGDSPERRIVLLVLDRALPEGSRADMGSAVQLAITGEGDAAAQMAKLAKIYVYETHAVVLFKEQDGWSSTPVTQEDGSWKLGAP